LGIELSPTQRAAIDGHVRLLLAWNRAINLTAIRDPADAARAHVVDSLSAAGLLRGRGVNRLVDLGSGGGFPGLPLAIGLPVQQALLVDSIGKKVRFLETAIGALDLGDRVGTYVGRAEELSAGPSHREAWPAVVVRAVATMPDLVELCFPLLERGGVLVAWKRGDIDAELAAAERAVAAMGGGALETHSVQVRSVHGHRLVVATKHGQTPLQFPRDPAVRRRVPW
jgi:16S rRNA (guanine527-N7)-methyltransferase